MICKHASADPKNISAITFFLLQNNNFHIVSHSTKYIQYISQLTLIDEYATWLVSVVELKCQVSK